LFRRPAVGQAFKKAEGGLEQRQGHLIFLRFKIERRHQLGIGTEAVLGKVGAADKPEATLFAREKKTLRMKHPGHANGMQQVTEVGQLGKQVWIFRGFREQLLILAVVQQHADVAVILQALEIFQRVILKKGRAEIVGGDKRVLELVLFEPVVQMQSASFLAHERKRITSSETCRPRGASLSGSSKPPYFIRPKSISTVVAFP